jgi:hypothetical protein
MASLLLLTYEINMVLMTGLMMRVHYPIFTRILNHLMEVVILMEGIIDMTHLTCRLMMMKMKRDHYPVPIFFRVSNQKMEVGVLAMESSHVEVRCSLVISQGEHHVMIKMKREHYPVPIFFRVSIQKMEVGVLAMEFSRVEVVYSLVHEGKIIQIALNNASQRNLRTGVGLS